MLRRKHGKSLMRAQSASEDVNPNAYITNIADCMLVLVLGLLVALIARYNVDLEEVPEDEDEMVGIEINLDSNEDGLIDDTFEERGSVYYDRSTGRFYYVTE